MVEIHNNTASPRGNHDEDHIQIEFSDELSGTRFLTARVGLAEFAEALTGLGCTPCRFRLNADKVGLKYEHKHEDVPFDRGQYTSDPDEQERLARRAFAVFEVDG